MSATDYDTVFSAKDQANAPTLAPLESYGYVARDMYANGWRPVPQRPGEKVPGKYDVQRGSWYNLKEWSKIAAGMPEGQLTHFENYVSASPEADSVGACAVITPGLVWVDLDSRDHSLKEDLIGILQELPGKQLRRVGSKGFAMPLRLAEGVTVANAITMDGDKVVEFLQAGKQVVCYGIHPGAGRPYEWITEDTPANTHIDELHELDQETIDGIFKMVALYGPAEWMGDNVEAQVSGECGKVTDFSGLGDGIFAAVNKYAFKDYEAWIHDLNLPRLKKVGLGYKAVPFWRSGGEHGDDIEKRKRNLSIDDKGIRDWAAFNPQRTDKRTQSFTPIDLVMTALVISDDEAMAWLMERSGPFLPPLPEGLNANRKKPSAEFIAPLPAEAKADLEAANEMAAAQAPSPDSMAAYIAANSDAIDESCEVQSTVKPARKSSWAEIKAELAAKDEKLAGKPQSLDPLRNLNPVQKEALADVMTPGLGEREIFSPDRAGGLLKSICEYNLKGAEYPSLKLALQSALCIAATTYGRRWATHTGAPLNLMTIGIGRTGLGKNRGKTVSANCLGFNPNLAQTLLPGRLTSDAAIHKALTTCPVRLSVIDEMGMVMKSAQDNEKSPERKVTAALLEIYNPGSGAWSARNSAGDDDAGIPNPHLTVLGLSTPETLIRGISDENEEDGLINRLLWFWEGADISPNDIESYQDTLPKSLRDEIEEAGSAMPYTDAYHGGNFEAARVHIPDASYTLTNLDADEDAKAEWKRTREWQQIVLRSEVISAGIVGRVAENTARLASLRALARGNGKSKICKSDIEWARDIVLCSACDVIRLLQMRAKMGVVNQQREKVFAIIRDNVDKQGGVRESVIKQYAGNMKVAELTGYLRDLKAAGRIECFKPGTKNAADRWRVASSGED